MRLKRLASTVALALTAVLCGEMPLFVENASAHIAHVPSMAFGAFAGVEGIAVDESAGYVYVLDRSAGGSIHKFDLEGNPVEFSALKAHAITGVGIGSRESNELAVDNSTGANKGDIYLASAYTLAIFASDGTRIGELNGAVAGPWGLPCGVAVDTTGNVYVGLFGLAINRYSASSQGPVSNESYRDSLTDSVLYNVCNLGVGADNVYALAWSARPVVGYPFSQFGSGNPSGVTISPSASAIAVDPARGLLYINGFHVNNMQISVFGEEGTRYGSFGEEELGVGGIAVDSATNVVYAAHNPTPNSVEIYKPIMLPDVTTLAPSEVAETNITLKGSVNPDGVQLTSCEFQYYATAHSASYDQSIPCSSAPGPGAGAVEVSAQLTGLAPNERYHYRLVAGNANGEEKGDAESFRTLSPLPQPVVSEVTISDLAPGAATVSGMVDSGGLPTRYEIDLGTDASYGTSSTGELVGSSQTVSMTLLYLQPSTTYHYRITATNQNGTASSGDLMFMTPAYPILLPQVLPQVAAPSIAFPAEEERAGKAKPKTKHKTTNRSKKRHKKNKHKKKK